MTENAEEGIARTQAAALKDQSSQGNELDERQKRSISYLDDRVLAYILVAAMTGLMMVWLNAKSALVLYGSLAGVILLVILWGVLQIRRIERVGHLRERQVEESKRRR